MDKADIDILFLTETKLNDHISEDRFKIEGSPLEYGNMDRKGGGGAIF